MEKNREEFIERVSYNNLLSLNTGTSEIPSIAKFNPFWNQVQQNPDNWPPGTTILNGVALLDVSESSDQKEEEEK